MNIDMTMTMIIVNNFQDHKKRTRMLTLEKLNIIQTYIYIRIYNNTKIKKIIVNVSLIFTRWNFCFFKR